MQIREEHAMGHDSGAHNPLQIRTCNSNYYDYV